MIKGFTSILIQEMQIITKIMIVFPITVGKKFK